MRLLLISLLAICLCALTIRTISAQQKPADMPLGFEEYDPISTLKVPDHKLMRAKYPFIDVHNHQWNMDDASLPPLLKQMDSLNMGIMVNLSGRAWGSEAESDKFFTKSLANIKQTNTPRLILFTNILFDGIGTPGWTEASVKRLEADVKAGAHGLKIYKTLGMDTTSAPMPLLSS